MKYGIILLGVHFNLRYSKSKPYYYKVIKFAYVMGVVQHHFYHSVKEITPRKRNLLWNTGHLDENNDVSTIFSVSYSANMIDFATTCGNFMNALEMQKYSEKQPVSRANNSNTKKSGNSQRIN